MDVFEERLARAQRLCRQRDWSSLKACAYAITRIRPTNKDGWKLLMLATHRVGGGQPEIDRYLLGARSSCPDWSNVDEGDVWRDMALALIRPQQGQGHDSGKLQSARRLIDAAMAEHGADDNRMTCLDLVSARLSEAQGELARAFSGYAGADAHWQRLANAGQPSDPQWRFDLLVHWQRLANRLGHKKLAIELAWRILRAVPRHGTWKHAGLALLLCVPGQWRRALP